MHNTKGSQKRVTAVDYCRKKESGRPKRAALHQPNSVNHMEPSFSFACILYFVDMVQFKKSV